MEEIDGDSSEGDDVVQSRVDVGELMKVGEDRNCYDCGWFGCAEIVVVVVIDAGVNVLAVANVEVTVINVVALLAVVALMVVGLAEVGTVTVIEITPAAADAISVPDKG